MKYRFYYNTNPETDTNYKDWREEMTVEAESVHDLLNRANHGAYDYWLPPNWQHHVSYDGQNLEFADETDIAVGWFEPVL